MLFAFENDFSDNLRCIPMVVRLKLDTCGVKLKLSDWNQLSQSDRLDLVSLPGATPPEALGYRNYVHMLVTEKTGNTPGDLPCDPHPPWFDESNIPPEVTAQAEKLGEIITIKQWAKLNPLQRFALIKLSRSSHENSNFLPAMKEFNLV